MEALEFTIINIILPLVVGGIGAYVYPRIDSYLKNRSLTTRERKLKDLRYRYYTIKKRKTIPEYLEFTRHIAIQRSVLWTGYIVTGGVFLLISLALSDVVDRTQGRIMLAAGYIFWSYLFVSWFRLITRFRTDDIDTYYFSKFREETIAKIKKLGGNPVEELNKIDKEFDDVIYVSE